MVVIELYQMKRCRKWKLRKSRIFNNAKNDKELSITKRATNLPYLNKSKTSEKSDEDLVEEIQYSETDEEDLNNLKLRLENGKHP